MCESSSFRQGDPFLYLFLVLLIKESVLEGCAKILCTRYQNPFMIKTFKTDIFPSQSCCSVRRTTQVGAFQRRRQKSHSQLASYNQADVWIPDIAHLRTMQCCGCGLIVASPQGICQSIQIHVPLSSCWACRFKQLTKTEIPRKKGQIRALLRPLTGWNTVHGFRLTRVTHNSR